MNIKNIERAAEIAKILPELEGARKLLSRADGETEICVSCKSEAFEIPMECHMNILGIVNVAINNIKKEVEGL
jgi:hypothetical protein